MEKEIRDLSDELRTHHDISHARLLRHLALGALAARLSLRRTHAMVTAGVAVIVIAGLPGAGTIALSSHTHRALTPAQRTRRPHVLTAQVVPSNSCFIDAGTACSLSACTQFIRRRSAPTGTIAADVTGGRPRCTSNPRQRHARPRLRRRITATQVASRLDLSRLCTPGADGIVAACRASRTGLTSDNWSGPRSAAARPATSSSWSPVPDAWRAPRPPWPQAGRGGARRPRSSGEAG
jgi:hypothetical protein